MNCMKGIIYKVTNLINGKIYIGKTIYTLNERKRCHKCESKQSNQLFHKAIRKYGWENFVWEILCKCDILLLNIRETMKIIVNHSHVSEGGYNLTWGGDGSSGYKQSEKSIRKRVDAIRNSGGYIRTKEQRKEMSKNRRGKKCSEYAIRRNREGHLGLKMSKETRIKMSESHKGFIRTEEHQKKLNESNKGSRKYTLDIIKKAFEMKNDGYSRFEISKLLNVPKSTIQYWFEKNEGENYYEIYTTQKW